MREINLEEDIDVEEIMENMREKKNEGYKFRVNLKGGGELVGVRKEIMIKKEKGKIV